MKKDSLHLLIYGALFLKLLDEASDIVNYFESDRDQFIDRTYNEFTVVNLKNLLLAIDHDRGVDPAGISFLYL